MEQSEGYDYILNLAALKHVRSEKDPYTLMRLVMTNIFASVKLAEMAYQTHARKYFCVSTDKAANPVNMMGASKRIMELFLMQKSEVVSISMARFANVAFSDGSLLHGFNQRLLKKQPISVPKDIKRFFITDTEAGQLCLISCLFGENREIFFPKERGDLQLTYLTDICLRFLKSQNLEPYFCSSEMEAREFFAKNNNDKKWPVYFFDSDTTGEKEYEEFFTDDEKVIMEKYNSLGVISCSLEADDQILNEFENSIKSLRNSGAWTKEDLVRCFRKLLINFFHDEKGKNLDMRM